MQTTTHPGEALGGYFDQNFGISAQSARQALSEALARGGDWADLYYQHSLSTQVGLQDGIVNKASRGVDLGVGVRVVAGDQTGYAFTESLEPQALKEAARTAASIAQGAARTAPVGIHWSKLPQHYDTAYDWQSVGVGQILPMLQGLEASIRQADPSVIRVQLTFSSQQSRILVVDSEGRAAFDNQPMTSLVASLVMERQGQRQSNSYNVSARRGLAFYDAARLEAFQKEILRRTAILFEARKPSGGQMPVVLAAGSSGILLHEAIGHGMEADCNRKGLSIFADRLGKKVAHENVTIVDSGLDPDFRGSINVDDEGNLPQKTYLVRGGVLTSYLHDRISARHYGVEPTGSGRRQSFRFAPLPRMRNTYMEAGPHKREEIIGAVKKGILAETFTNGQVNIGQGDYTFYVKNGWLIEEGKITAPIRDVNIIGNGPESLSQISMVADDFAMDGGGWTCGKDGQGVPVSLGLPTVLVDQMTVGGDA